MKKKTIKAWLRVDERGYPITCHCHPSGKLAYTVYAKKSSDFPDRYWREIELPQGDKLK